MIVVAALARGGSGGTGAGAPEPSTTAPPAADLLAITDPPDRYRVVYRLEEFGDDARVTTEEVVVDRPFRSRRTLWLGDGPRGAPVRTSISDFGLLSVRSKGSTDLTVATTVTPATGDLRFEHALAELVEQGRLEDRGRSVVLGAPCQVVRTLEPIGTARLAPPTDTEWTDVCIDGHGLMVQEDWHLGGRLFQRRVAREIQVGDDVPTVSFAPFSEPVAVEAGGGAVRPVDPTSRPDFTYWEAADPPAGFTHRGRYELLVPSQLPSAGDPSTAIGPPFREVADVYERGADFIVISRGSFVNREAEFDRRPHGIEVDLGAIGTGELDVGVFGTWLRVETDAVQFLSIRGTVDPGELVALGRRLEPSPRGHLVYLDDR